MELYAKTVQARFIELFRQEPMLVRAPGRINLIGEHTDYNDGFVMPAAIDKVVIVAIAPSPEATSTIHSVKYNESISIDIPNLDRVKTPAWANYLLGVLFQIHKDGHNIKPFQCVFGGDIPLGAGMSSSAALECGFAYAINELNRLDIPKKRLIEIAQWAEHHYAGVKCGIMDQFASVMGKKDHALVLDCRSLAYRYVPVPLNDHDIILCDTRVKHALVDSAYNTRRQECETGVGVLKKYFPNIKSLRDVSEEMVNMHKAEFPGKVYDRCLYVVQEIKRVVAASVDLEKGDLQAFGKKMYETHVGLSQLYDVSCAELDFLVNESRKIDAVLGARMMGGGFGGCTINIVRKKEAELFIKLLQNAYRQKFSKDMPAYRVKIRAGAGVMSQADVSVL